MEARFVEHRSHVASFATIPELKQRYNGFTVVGEEESWYKMFWYSRDIGRLVRSRRRRTIYEAIEPRLDHTGFFDGLYLRREKINKRLVGYIRTTILYDAPIDPYSCAAFMSVMRAWRCVCCHN